MDRVDPPAPALPGGRGLFEVRFHGRGGQGTVISSILLAYAAFLEGRGVQAFPFFGVERRGAPVVAHARIGTEPVRLACSVASPDAVVVMDPTLLKGLGARMWSGVRPGGWVLANCKTPPQAFIGPGHGFQAVGVDAAGIARRHRLGSAANPIVNTAMLGAFARMTGIVRPESLESAIREKVPARIEENVQAARDGAAEADRCL